MACDIGTPLFILQLSLEPNTSYIAGVYLSEEIAKTMANNIIGIMPTWYDKKPGALHLGGWTEAGTGFPGFNRGVYVAIEEHELSEEP